MNEAYREILAASDDDRRDLFLGAAGRLGTAAQNIEKDFWLDELGGLVANTMRDAGFAPDRARLVLDDTDPDRQTLLFWYPGVIADAISYVQSAVKIESGAKSALDPHQAAVVAPYVAADLPRLDLRVPNITTVEPKRTFWDKVVILHGQRRWFERRGELRHGGQRVSRHYYDLYRLLNSDVAERALADRDLGVDCARHARMFFKSPDYDLSHAVPGTFSIVPSDGMRDVLRRDYEAMAGMIFGAVPSFEDVMATIATLEERVNA